jgi:pimeloyl-ACP methyl ester carboxylesterase
VDHFRKLPIEMHLLLRLNIILLLLLCATGPAIAESPAISIASPADQYVTTDSGVKLHFVEKGVGPPVVLLHGNEGTLQDFTLTVFDALATKYQALAFDRPGHGQSGTVKRMATPEVQAKLLHDALLKLKIDHPLLVAHSWSGSVALSYAVQFPNDLSGIVLLAGMAYDTKETAPKPSYYAVRLPIVGPTLALYYKATGRKEIRKRLEEAFAPDPAPAWYVEKFLATMFRLSELRAVASDEITLNTTLKKIRPLYGDIKVPVVIVAGDHDQTVPPDKNSYELSKAIPQSTLIVIKNAGHELQFTKPEEVLKAIDLAFQLPATIASK